MSDINDIIRLKTMGKDETVMRVDVRVPLGMYERIELLAENTNQPFTPKTKNTKNPKRVVTPIILKLIDLGLGVIDEDSSKLTEELSISGEDNSESIEDRLFRKLETRLETRLDELIETRLKELRADKKPESEYVKNLYAIEVNSEVVIEDTEAINPEIITEVKEVSALENSEDNSEPDLLPKEVQSEVKESIAPSEGFSSGKLAERFKTNKKQGEGASKTTINTNKTKLSKEEFINWSKEQDPEGKGWYLNETDKKFYPL